MTEQEFKKKLFESDVSFYVFNVKHGKGNWYIDFLRRCERGEDEGYVQAVVREGRKLLLQEG